MTTVKYWFNVYGRDITDPENDWTEHFILNRIPPFLQEYEFILSNPEFNSLHIIWETSELKIDRMEITSS